MVPITGGAVGWIQGAQEAANQGLAVIIDVHIFLPLSPLLSEIN